MDSGIESSASYETRDERKTDASVRFIRELHGHSSGISLTAPLGQPVALAAGKGGDQTVRTMSSCVRVARIVSVSRSAAIDA